jgi:hypothetical protein
LAAETIAEDFIKSRHEAGPSTPAMDVSGSYEFSAQNSAGKQVSGTFLLTKSKTSGYAGHILPEKEPQHSVRRSQDGSYGPPEIAEISIAHVTVNGNQVHIVGADSNAFVHAWFTLKGDAIDGRWIGRDVTGPMRGIRRSNVGSSASNQSTVEQVH